MDDIIVIILTLVFAFFGILGQIRKKKPVQENQQPEKKPEGFWDFLNEQENEPLQEVDEDELTGQPHETFKKSESRLQKEMTAQKPGYQYTPKNEGSSAFKNDITNEKSLPERKPIKRQKTFSLRKAVIYNEILNRKYK